VGSEVAPSAPGDRGYERSCTVVDTHGNLQCTTTVLLPGGTLEVVYTDNVNAKEERSLPIWCPC
jgi:hypothetical protein